MLERRGKGSQGSIPGKKRRERKQEAEREINQNLFQLESWKNLHPKKELRACHFHDWCFSFFMIYVLKMPWCLFSSEVWKFFSWEKDWEHRQTSQTQPNRLTSTSLNSLFCKGNACFFFIVFPWRVSCAARRAPSTVLGKHGDTDCDSRDQFLWNDSRA